MLKTKRSELLRLFVVFALLAVSVGIVLISAAKVDTSAQLTSPSIVRGIAQPALHNLTIANSTINFTLTVSAGSNAMVRADFNRPAAFSVINCPVLLPAGWTCTKDNGDLVRYQNADGLAAGSSATFGINGTVTAISQNVSWTIDTYENTGGTIGSNSTKANVTVDADAPLVTLLNVTDGRHMFINTTNLTDGSAWVAYRDLTFNVSVSDIFYNVVNVSVYFNLSNVTPSGTFQPPNPGIGYNRSVVRLTSANPLGGYYNGTLVSTLSSTGSMPIVLNSTYRIYFAVVANDSAGNINITNGTAASFFNISVDGAAPVAYFPSRVRGSGIDDLFDAAIDNITTSSTTHNFSILVYDYEGSGVKNVWINASSNLLPSGVLTAMGSNNCGGVAAITVTGETCWNISSTLQGLGLSTGDQNATISYVLNDTVGNLNYTHETPFKMYLLVDDAAFTVVVTSNATSNFTKNNATVVNITAIINANLNFTDSTTHLPNVTINGPHLVRYNMTFKSAASRWNAVGLATQYLYQSTWFSSVHPSANSTVLIGSNGSTNSTLGEFGCINGDGVACTLQITWNDIFGRLNSSNITITIDSFAPLLVNFTVENATNDVFGSSTTSSQRPVVVRSTDLLNFTVNAQNNIANVTLHNASSASTNSTLMTAGGERNFSLQIRPTALCITEGRCVINVSTIDSALNFNQSGTAGYTLGTSSITIIVDDSAPWVSGELGNLTTLSSAIQIGNTTGEEPDAYAGNITGNAIAIFRGLNASVVKGSAILNISVLVNDTYTNITLVSIRNSSSMNLSNRGAGPLNPERWWGRNSTNELCGLTGVNVETTCTLVITAKDNASNTNSTTQFVVRVDNLAPRVLNFSTNLTISHKVIGSGHQINFSVNISDMNIANFNVSIANGVTNESKPMNRSGSSNDNSTTTTFWVVASLSELGCTANGNCTIKVVANDSVNNVNNSVSMFVQLDSTTISTVGMNLSPTTGTSNPLISASPTLWLNLTTNSLCRYSANSVAYDAMTPMTGNSSTIHSASVGPLADGTYNYYFRCADLLGVEPANVFPQSIAFTIQNPAAPVLTILNVTTGATFITSQPTVHVNTSVIGLCRYSTTATNYSDMGTQFTAEGSTFNSFTLSDKIDNDYAYLASCTNSSNIANVNRSSTANDRATFTVDTRSLWNITVGATGALSAAKDYFTSANKFYTFTLPNTNVLATTSLNGGTYNVTTVLTSIMGASPGSASTNNLSVLWAYNRTGNSWSSFVYGRSTNTFINFTADVFDYYINLTNGSERIEIN